MTKKRTHTHTGAQQTRVKSSFAVDRARCMELARKKSDEFYKQAEEIFDLHFTNRNIDVIIP